MRFAHNLRRNTAMPLSGSVRQLQVLTFWSTWYGCLPHTPPSNGPGAHKTHGGHVVVTPSMCRAGATMDQQPVIDLGPLGDIDRSGDLLREQIWLDPSRNLIHGTNLGRLCEREVRSADEGPGAGEIWCVFIPLLEGSDAKFRGLHDFSTLLLWGGCQRGLVGRSFSNTLSPS